MGKGENLGEFEQLVMLALVRLKDDAYGMQVRREIQSRTERSVTIGSVYATLDRLEKKGYVVPSVPRPVTRSRKPAKGRGRKYFRLTPEGAKALLERQDTIRRMTEGLSLRNELEAI